MNRLRQKLQILVTIAAMVSCGRAGLKSSSSGDQTTVIGSITTQFGGQTEMAGWVLALVEKDTGIAHVAEADGAGIFTVRGVAAGQAHTIVLLSPDYITFSVLSMPPLIERTIRQYFIPTSIYIPRLIFRGQIIQFDTTDSLEILPDMAVDSDANLIPDGTTQISLRAFPWSPSSADLEDNLNFYMGEAETDGDGEGDDGGHSLSTPTSDVDTDLDGDPNSTDPDIDGDGIPNEFDPDDDADSIIDYFDFDANGDLLADSIQEIGDLYYPVGVKFVSVSFESKPQDDGTTKNTLTFVTKLRGDITPSAVQVRGANSLFNDAIVEYIDESDGSIIPADFNRLLLDNGESEDGGPNDNVFARRVTLATGKAPRAHQSMFIQLALGTPTEPKFNEYIFTFPDITTQEITALYDATTRTVQISGNPFGDAFTDYLWSVNVFNSSDQKIYTSTAQFGSNTQHTLPANILEETETYRASVVAQVVDRVPGYSSYIIHSPRITLE